jgi:integrase/recombinase XerD
MNGIPSPTADLDRSISSWLAHQRALGRGCDDGEWLLGRVRLFVANIPAPDLDRAGFDLWCDSFRHLTATTRRTYQLIVRRFCLYRRRTEPGCFVPDALYFVRPCAYRRPVIIEPAHVTKLLVAADNLTATSDSPLLPAVMRLAIVILYTAGLRRGELVRLTLDDVEPQAGILRIRASKFHKSRLVPLSADAGEELQAYLRKRLASPFTTGPGEPLLGHGERGGRQYTGGGMARVINRLFTNAEVTDGEGRRPRVHDVRHSFAVQALTRWYRGGADVQSNLPRLAMYMGHVSIVSTAHYLHFVPAMRELASDRFESAFGDLIEEMSE